MLFNPYNETDSKWVLQFMGSILSEAPSSIPYPPVHGWTNSLIIRNITEPISLLQ